jgi:hypothetical protein
MHDTTAVARGIGSSNWDCAIRRPFLSAEKPSGSSRWKGEGAACARDKEIIVSSEEPAEKKQ